MGHLCVFTDWSVGRPWVTRGSSMGHPWDTHESPVARGSPMRRPWVDYESPTRSTIPEFEGWPMGCPQTYFQIWVTRWFVLHGSLMAVSWVTYDFLLVHVCGTHRFVMDHQ